VIASLATVTQSSEATALASFAGKLSRTTLLAGGVAVALIAAAVVVVLATSGGSHARAPRAAASTMTRRVIGGGSASTTRASSARANATAASGANASAGRRVAVAETADPEEAKSFPAPASVHHKAAATPTTAAERFVAAGAPSDAEVKQELAQMQAVERSAKQRQQVRMTPVPGGESVGGNGTIPIPANMPEAVQRVIAGGNAIADFPYVFGGGHASFVDNAYDCSGSVSYALAAGGLIGVPETSGELEHWGLPGPGRYISVYANAGHAYMYVDGVLFDTAGRSGVYASRWQVAPTDNAGYVVRHPPGL
jgi:cell wall-associated NlpC family hydrolase